MKATTDDGEPATGRWVAGQMRAALEALKEVASTGSEKVDQDLLLAEQAIRRVMVAAKDDPD